MALTDSQPAEECCGQDGVSRESLDDALRQVWQVHSVSRKGAVTDDRTCRIDHHEGCRDPSAYILPDLRLKVLVELGDPAVERGPVVRSGQGLYAKLSDHRKPVFLRYSRAAFRKAGPGPGGLRIVSTKISASRMLRISIARFSMARSAAVSAACKTKSVMLRPSRSAARWMRSFCSRLSRASKRYVLAGDGRRFCGRGLI